MRNFDLVTVVDRQAISPNMVRIGLTADCVSSFADNVQGGHIKLVFPEVEQASNGFLRFLSGANVRKRMRTYTVRHIDKNNKRIDIDFVVHGDDGPASSWALSAKVGDQIAISNPAGPKLKMAASNHYLFAVDMTGFPAAAAGLESLPNDATGDVFVDILSKDDVQPVNAPKGMRFHWIANQQQSEHQTSFSEHVRRCTLTGKESIFVAGEYEVVCVLRDYFRKEKNFPKDQLYISSYWKRGLIEMEHKRIKALVA